MLWIGTGDGGAADDQGAGHASGRQRPVARHAARQAAAHRPDADRGRGRTRIPPDNPFANGGGRPEIWAYGLRNPWKFSFDADTGALVIGDVGQNQ